MRSVIPWLLASLAMVAALPCSAQASRWSASPLPGAMFLSVAGRESSGLVAIRSGLDPIRSVDAGATWTAFAVAGMRPVDLFVSPTDASTWYAIPVNGTLYRTRDSGATWTQQSQGHYGPYPRLERFQPGAHPDLLYASHVEIGTCPPSPCPLVTGLFASVDGGATWRHLQIPTVGIDPRLHVSPADERVAFLVSSQGLLRTDDQGASWRAVAAPAASPEFDWRMAMTLDRRDPRIAYFHSGYRAVYWATRDGGTSWTRHSKLPGVLVADPLESLRVYLFAEDGSVHESRDAGSSWAKVVDAGSGPANPAIAVHQGRREALALGIGSLRKLDLADGALFLGSDLWLSPVEQGWGLTITQHPSNRPFVVWYTYDAAGAPVWRVVPGGAWNDRAFTGEMFETTGPPYFSGPFDPARVATRRVGTATLRFDDENNAMFSYAMGTAGAEKRVTRQLFAAPAPATAENFADLWWNAAEPGWGVAVNHQYNRIFATWYVYGDDGKPLWVVMPDAVVGNGFVGAVVRPVASGDIYTTRGPAAAAPFNPALVVPSRIGTATFIFRSAGEATLEYTAFGRTESRSITRQPF